MEERLKKRLTEYFDEMLTMTPKFKKKEYDAIFSAMLDEYGEDIKEISSLFEGLSSAQEDLLLNEIAEVIPTYAKEKMEKLSKRGQNKEAIEYNLAMAVYVVPGLSYTKNEKLVKIAEKTVEKWNAMGVTSLELGLSTYEDITGGFRKKLCFITTAVCDHLNKPDNCYELETLRDYRDHYLLTSAEGKELVEEYYNIAPSLVFILNMKKDQSIYEGLYTNYITPCLKSIEDHKLEDCKNIYKKMVNHMKYEYFPS
ncbi:MAG TPA: hypothetical protein H9887_07610 [Candidatus Dorea intestinavium]|nr:hypothetical protein [Candidatus Dorea intestinavium]